LDGGNKERRRTKGVGGSCRVGSSGASTDELVERKIGLEIPLKVEERSGVYLVVEGLLLPRRKGTAVLDDEVRVVDLEGKTSFFPHDSNERTDNLDLLGVLINVQFGPRKIWKSSSERGEGRGEERRKVGGSPPSCLKLT